MLKELSEKISSLLLCHLAPVGNCGEQTSHGSQHEPHNMRPHIPQNMSLTWPERRKILSDIKHTLISTDKNTNQNTKWPFGNVGEESGN